MKPVDVLGYAGLALGGAALLVRLLFEGSGTASLGLLVAGIVFFVIYLFRSEASVQGFLRRRSTREGGNVLGTTIFVVGILVLLNLLAVTANWRKDITADRIYSLAPETEAALRAAPAAPHVFVFYPRTAREVEGLRLILDAARQVRPDMEVKVMDPWQEPAQAARFNLKDYSTVIQVGDRHETFFGISEEAFTTALLRASQAREGRIGFFRGHGEPLVNDPEPGGMRTTAVALKARGYVPYSVDLHQGAGLGDSLDAVLIVGPKKPFSAAESDSVIAYLKRGGRLLVLLDPTSPVTLDSILARAGFRFDPRFVADPGQRQPQVLFPAFTNHPAVEFLAHERIQVVLSGAGEVEIKKPPRDVLQFRLLSSGPNSRIADDPESVPRSRALAAAATLPAAGGVEARMVVVGDSGFLLNERVDTLGNQDLILGLVRWVARGESASIRPRARTNRPVVLSRQQGRAFMVLLAGLLPAAVFLSGLGVWWRRR